MNGTELNAFEMINFSDSLITIESTASSAADYTIPGKTKKGSPMPTESTTQMNLLL